MNRRIEILHDNQPIAFMGGAYGNVPALRACLDDARNMKAETCLFLGDATGCCGHSDETLDMIRAQIDWTVAGNHEREACAGSTHCNCGYADADDERWSCTAHSYALDSLSNDRREALADWPDQLILRHPCGDILCCHGSPDHINEFLYESELNDQRIAHWLDEVDCRAMVCTHTGLPWMRRVSDGRLAVNCGAVGKPDHDGDPAVHYALYTPGAEGWGVTIRRVVYDHEAWASQLAAEGVEPIFTSPLRTGWWTLGLASLPESEKARLAGNEGR